MKKMGNNTVYVACCYENHEGSEVFVFRNRDDAIEHIKKHFIDSVLFSDELTMGENKYGYEYFVDYLGTSCAFVVKMEVL